MDPSLAERILAAGRMRQLAPGDSIAMAGDEEGGLFAIATGTIFSRQSAATPDIPMTDMHIAPFWLISRAFLPGQEWVTTVAAQTPVTILHIPRPVLAQMLGEHPELYLHILRIVSAIFARMTVALSDALIRKASDRCIAVLLRISERRFSGDDGVDLPIGQMDLAGMANLSRQKVGEVLRELEEAGLVELGYRRIGVLAPARLRAMLEA